MSVWIKKQNVRVFQSTHLGAFSDVNIWRMWAELTFARTSEPERSRSIRRKRFSEKERETNRSEWIKERTETIWIDLDRSGVNYRTQPMAFILDMCTLFNTAYMYEHHISLRRVCTSEDGEGSSDRHWSWYNLLVRGCFPTWQSRNHCQWSGQPHNSKLCGIHWLGTTDRWCCQEPGERCGFCFVTDIRQLDEVI